MMEEEIIASLRSLRGRLTAVELAEFVGTNFADGLSQGSLVTFFQRAFPEIPLRVLLDAGAWHRVSGGGLSDSEFNVLLRPWL